MGIHVTPNIVAIMNCDIKMPIKKFSALTMAANSSGDRSASGVTRLSLSLNVQLNL